MTPSLAYTINLILDLAVVFAVGGAMFAVYWFCGNPTSVSPPGSIRAIKARCRQPRGLGGRPVQGRRPPPTIDASGRSAPGRGDERIVFSRSSRT